ncbi:unnamed protein product, partial [Brenthis ino]
MEILSFTSAALPKADFLKGCVGKHVRLLMTIEIAISSVDTLVCLEELVLGKGVTVINSSILFNTIKFGTNLLVDDDDDVLLADSGHGGQSQ